MEHQIEDEPLTRKTPQGFQTSWIRTADLKGSFDRLEPEVSSDFPASFAQKRQVIMELLKTGDETIKMVLFSPENADLMKSYMGLNELKIPMAGQRNKQIREIMQMIGFAPNDMGNGMYQATVPVEPEIDDHEVHIEILKEFLVSNSGQDLKRENMAGYANCLTHLIEHQMAMMPPPVLGPPVQPGAPAPGAMAPPQSAKAPNGAPAHVQ
jgi:hypothetical protein